MKLLAIDTATPQVSVALWGDPVVPSDAGLPPGTARRQRSTSPGGLGLLAGWRVGDSRRHAELLAPAIVGLLATAGLTASDLDGLAVDIGPGLFTGLRVGVATAKALGSALGLAVVTATSLEVLARAQRREGRLVAAVVDARRREVFRALYRGGPTGLVEVAPPAVCTPADLAAELAGRGEAVLAVGDGARRYGGELAGAGSRADPGDPRGGAGGAGVEIGGALDAYPDAAVLAEWAAERLAAEPGCGLHPAALVPLYLRAADVRIGWDVAPARS